MIRTIQLLAVLLILSFNSVGQQRYITSFYDYKSCLSGFMDDKGDTLFAPQFKSVGRTTIAKKKANGLGWIVKKNKKEGLLSMSGEYLIPIEYDRIYFVDDSVFVISNTDNKRGLIDLTTGKIMEPAYDEINYKPNHRLYYVRNGDYKGIVTKSLDVLVEPIYQDIDYLFKYNKRDDYYDTLDVFRIKKDGYYGLLNREGTTFLPLVYHALNRVTITDECSKKHFYFEARNKDGDFGILSIQGDTLIPFEYWHGKMYTYFENCSKVMSQIAIMRNKNGYQAFNLLSGKKSDYYMYLFQHNDKFLFTDKNRCGVLDASFNEIEILEGKGMLVSPEARYASLNRTLNKSRFVRHFPPNYDTMNPVLTWYHVNPKKKHRYKIRGYNKYLRSLYNIETGKQTGIHSSIASVYQNGDTVFWALDFNGVPLNKIKRNSLKRPIAVTIYDKDFNKKFSRNIRSRYVENFVVSDELYNSKFREPFLFQDENKKVGVVAYNGDILVPFEFDTSPRVVRIPRSEEKTDSYFLLSKDGKKGMYGADGKELLECRYRSISYYDNKFTAFVNDTGYYFDSNVQPDTFYVYKKKIDTATHVTTGKNVGYYKYSKTKYFVKRGYLYYRDLDSTTNLVDSGFVQFNSTIRSVIDKYVVTQQGKVLHTGSYRISGQKGGCFVIQKQHVQYYSNTYEKLLDLRNCIMYSINNDRVVIGISGKRGVFDTNLNKWILEPKYTNIAPSNNGRSFGGSSFDGFWASESKDVFKKRKKNKVPTPLWIAYDKDGKPLFDVELNENHFFYNNKDRIVQRELSFGVLSTEGKLLVPPVYDFIKKVDGGYFLYKDKRWYIYSNGKISQESFDEVALIENQKGFVVFNNEKIAILDSDLNTVLRYKSHAEFLKADVIELLGLNPSRILKTLDGQYYGIDSKSDSVFINHWAWRKFQKASTIQYFKTKKAFNGSERTPKNAPLESYYSNRDGILSVRLMFEDDKYYSEKSEFHTVNYYNRKSYSSKVTNYNTYKITGDTIVELGFRDLIIPGKEDVLDSLMIEELSRVQAYGNRCVDLLGEIGDLKMRFCLGQYGLEFHNVSRNVSSISIPYYLLEGVLKLY